MNEESAVVTREKPKKRRSLWWLWLLLMLVVFAGGVVLGLKLTTMPLPYDVLGRFFPEVVQAQQAVTATAAPVEVAAAPEVTAQPAAEGTQPAVEEKETEIVPTETPAPTVFEKQETETFATGKYIGVDAALKAALDRAKVKEEDAEISGVHRTKDEDGQTVYEVGFSVNDIRYDYVINAYSGEVESWVMSNFSFSDTQTYAAAATGTFDSNAESAAETEELIDAERAKEIAYRDAGVRAAEVLRIRTTLVEESGKDVYEVEFRTISKSYSYQIDAVTGEILKNS